MRGWSLANICFLYESEMESVNLILLHCFEVRESLHLLFSIFKVISVLSFEGNPFKMSWFYCGRKAKASLKPIVYFLDLVERKKLKNLYIYI